MHEVDLFPVTDIVLHAEVESEIDLRYVGLVHEADLLSVIDIVLDAEESEIDLGSVGLVHEVDLLPVIDTVLDAEMESEDEIQLVELILEVDFLTGGEADLEARFPV
jgi:hypothetical protein